MTNNIHNQMINGHKIAIGNAPYADHINNGFPWIQIDDGVKVYVDTDGDHWGSIGIENPEVLKGTILEDYLIQNEYTDSWEFDMGGQFFVFDGDHTQLIDYDDIITPLGLIDNYEGAYGNG